LKDVLGALNIYAMKDSIQPADTEKLSDKEKRRIYYINSKEKRKAYIEANKDKFKTYQKSYHKSYHKAYNEANKDRIKAYHKAWREINKQQVYTARRLRFNNDLLFRFVCILREHSRRAFKRIGQNKPASTQAMLGCDWHGAKEHIERLFQPGMTWSNHGMWHIDHVIPIATATTTEEAIKLNHISNLQPLWAEDNLAKGSKLSSSR